MLRDRSGAGGRAGHARRNRRAQTARAYRAAGTGARSCRGCDSAGGAGGCAAVFAASRVCDCRSGIRRGSKRRRGAAQPSQPARAAGGGAGVERLYPARAAQGPLAGRPCDARDRAHSGAADRGGTARGIDRRAGAAHALRGARAAHPDLHAARGAFGCARADRAAGVRQDHDPLQAGGALRTRAGRGQPGVDLGR